MTTTNPSSLKGVVSVDVDNELTVTVRDGIVSCSPERSITQVVRAIQQQLVRCNRRRLELELLLANVAPGVRPVE